MAAETRLGQRKEPFTISGNGKQVRDVLHAQDMVSLYFSIAKSMDRARGQVFNAGGGMDNSLSLLELFNLLETEIGSRLNFTQLPPRSSDQRLFVADITKLKRLIGWGPSVSAHQGVSLMMQWTESVIAGARR
jgi:CDP-paratose 2-epimerase